MAAACHKVSISKGGRERTCLGPEGRGRKGKAQQAGLGLFGPHLQTRKTPSASFRNQSGERLPAAAIRTSKRRDLARLGGGSLGSMIRIPIGNEKRHEGGKFGRERGPANPYMVG